MSDRRAYVCGGSSQPMNGIMFPNNPILQAKHEERLERLQEGTAGQRSIVAELNGGTGLISLDPTLVSCPKCQGACVFVDGEDSWPCRNCRGVGRVPAATKTLSPVQPVNELPEQSETEWEADFFKEEC